MTSIRCERAIPGGLARSLRDPIERAAEACGAICDVFVYPVIGQGEVVLRVSVGQAVLPLLFRSDQLQPERVYASLKGALASARF